MANTNYGFSHSGRSLFSKAIKVIFREESANLSVPYFFILAIIRFILRLYKKYTDKRFINKYVFQKFIKKARFISRIRRRRVNLRNFELIGKKNWRLNLRRNLYTIKKIHATKLKKISLLSRKIENKAKDLHNRNYYCSILWTGLFITENNGELSITTPMVFVISSLIILGCLIIKKKKAFDITEKQATTEKAPEVVNKSDYDGVMDFWKLYKRGKNLAPQHEFKLGVDIFDDNKYNILKIICKNQTGLHPIDNSAVLSQIKCYLLEHLDEIKAAGYQDKYNEIMLILNKPLLHLRLKTYYFTEAKKVENSVSVWPTEEYIALNTLINDDNSADQLITNLDTKAQLKTLLERFKAQIISGNYNEADIAKFRYVRSVLKINSRIEYTDEMLKDLLKSNDLENQFEVLYYLAIIKRPLTQEQQSSFENWFQEYSEELKHGINHLDPSLITSMLNVIIDYIINN